MKWTKIFLLLIFLLTNLVFSQQVPTNIKEVTVELQFVNPIINGNVFDVTVQARVTTSSLDLPAGSADLCFHYEPLGLANPRILYKLNFSDTSVTYQEPGGRTFHQYAQNMSVLATLGLAHLQIVHFLPAMPSEQYYSTLSKAWTDLAVIRFDVINPSQNSNLIWDFLNTSWLEKNNLLSVPNFTGYSLTYPLPVEISLFTVTNMFETVNVVWVTRSETNCYGFEIQKAQDVPAGFQVVAFVNGQGTTVTGHEYRYVDHSTQGTWFYRLVQIDLDGKRTIIAPIEVNIILGKTSTSPQEYTLLQNYPNPFNNATTIVFSIPKPGSVKLKVYDISGKLVKVILDEKLSYGKHVRYFFSDGIPSGMYFYALEYDNIVIRKKMVLLK